LHVGEAVPTVVTPSPASMAGYLLLGDVELVQKSKVNAKKFTDAVTQDLNSAPDRLALLSIGAGGFTCNGQLLEPWFQRVPSHNFVVRHHSITYKNGLGPKLSPQSFVADGNAWWRQYQSEDDLQSRKDLRSTFALVPGHNV
jgi:hypothetical protein